MTINPILGGQDGVNDDVFHSRYDVLFDRQLVLRVLLVEVILEDLETHGVASFVHSEGRFFLDLEAVVGQVHHDALGVDIVFVAGGSQVAFFIEVEINLSRIIQHMNKRPYPNIELPTFKEEGPLDVLLHNPRGVRWLLINELHDLSDLAKQVDPSALVQSCWLQDPSVVFAMFLRNIFIQSNSLSNVQIRKPLLEPHHFTAC